MIRPQIHNLDASSFGVQGIRRWYPNLWSITRPIHAVVTIALVVLAANVSQAEQTVGNGGDPLQKIFLEARKEAAQRVQTIKKCSFSSDTEQPIRDWILSHRAELVSDLLRTQQIWITDHQSTCAFTQPKEAADVTLSFESCRPHVKTVEDARHILVHESVHHFDITDENFAEAIARAVDRILPDSPCPVDPTDPFNPDACPGKPITPKEYLSYFSAGGEPVTFQTQAPIVFRKRKCLGPTEDLCTEWKYKAQGQIRLDLSIVEKIPRVWGHMNICGGSWACSATSLVEGIFSPLVKWTSTSQLYFLDPNGTTETVTFPATGRFTYGCMVLRAKVDQEREIGFLTQF